MRALRASVSTRTSPTALSSSVWDTLHLHVWMVDDARDRDNLVAAHDQRPRLALRPWDLGVHEYVLDLLSSAGESVARPPASYLKASELGLDPPLAPANRTIERDRAALQPEAVVLAGDPHTVAQIEPLRSPPRCDQLGGGRLAGAALPQRTPEGGRGSRGELA